MTAGSLASDLVAHMPDDVGVCVVALVLRALWACEDGENPRPWVAWGEA